MVWGGWKRRRRVEMSQITHKITLPIQNHPPDLQLRPQKRGFVRELGGFFCLWRAEKSRRPGARRVKTSREGGKVAPTWN